MSGKSSRAEPVTIHPVGNILDGRTGYRLKAPWGHVSILEGGGHICELNLKGCDGVNPLWRPPWKTIDPQKYNATKHARTYGPLPDGRLLAGIAGHNLSFDYFGPPSKEEVAAGNSTHGEAPSVKWQLKRATGASASILLCSAMLPESQISFARETFRRSARSGDLLRGNGPESKHVRPADFMERARHIRAAVRGSRHHDFRYARHPRKNLPSVL